MAPVLEVNSHLVNPLASLNQLANFRQHDVSLELQRSMLFASARLTQTAGILLRLPQDIIAQAVVIFQRFWIGKNYDGDHDGQEISAASLYLAAKLSALPKSPRSIVNTYAYIDAFPTTFTTKQAFAEGATVDAYFVSEGTYQIRRDQLAVNEMLVLKAIGFDTHVALPYNICINYLQALDVFDNPEAAAVLSKRAFAHLNTALLSPQLVYLTHQPSSLATAAIYLAAKEAGIKLPAEEWWEVFDTDREELGFLVVAMISVEGFARGEAEQMIGRKVPTKA